MLEKGNIYYDNLENFCKNLQINLKAIFPEVFSKKESELKASILKASDQYLFDENTSLWPQAWFKDAYLAYFILTQSSRLYYAFNRVNGLIDFAKITNIIDFGCGPASAHLAAQAVFDSQLDDCQWMNIDSSKEAIGFAKKIETQCNLSSSYSISSQIPPPKSSNDLLILSFALCEGLNTDSLLKYKYILLLEPGQFTHSKNLIALREQALLDNFVALAPCPHQKSCPMKEGKKNWCHDIAPKPKSLPSYSLPFSSDKLNFSYLLLKKNDDDVTPKGLSRVIGDIRPEKGKSKIAICNSETPLFLSWLKKSKLNLNLSRGDLISLPEKAHKKGQEVRIEDNIKHFEFTKPSKK